MCASSAGVWSVEALPAAEVCDEHVRVLRNQIEGRLVGGGVRVSGMRIPFERVVALDAELARLGRQAGAIRWQVGAALERVAEKQWHHELGFASMDAYAWERCERTGRWAADSRAVARRLAPLQVLRRALASGEVSWSMAELVSRFATPENEDMLLERARGVTVRGMKELLRTAAVRDWSGAGDERSDAAGMHGRDRGSPAAAGGEDNAHREDGADEYRTLTLTMDLADAWLFERTRILLERLTGRLTSDALVQGMAAEALSSLVEHAPAHIGDLGEDDEEEARRAAWSCQLKRWRERGEELCEANVGDLLGLGAEAQRVDVGAVNPEQFVQKLSEFATARDLDRWIEKASQTLARRDVRIGEIAEELHRADGWRRLGFASEAQYSRERVGMCFSSLKERRALARTAQRLPEVEQAVVAGKIGTEAARLLARVSSAATVCAWIERAQVRTLRHLQEEVELGEMVKRLTSRPDCWPPSEQQMHDFACMEAAVVYGEARTASAEEGASTKPDGPSQAGARGVGVEPEAAGVGEGQSQMSGGGSDGTPASGSGDCGEGVSSAAGGEGAARRATRASSREEVRARAQAAWRRATGRLLELLTVGWVGDVGGRAPRGGVAQDSDPERGGDPACSPLVCEVMERLVRELSSGEPRSAAQLSGFGAGPGVGRVRFSLRVRRETARFWRRLEAEAHRVLPRGVSFVRFVCFAVWAAWSHVLEERVAYDHIYARDRHRCTCPVCGRRGVTPHHLRFRGHGGDDSDENVTSLCVWCHLFGVHEARLVARPPASKILWMLGSEPWLVVYGREKMTPEEWARRTAGRPGPGRSAA